MHVSSNYKLAAKVFGWIIAVLEPNPAAFFVMERLPHIDALRGIAALAVCWFHMTHGGDLLGDNAAAEMSSFGFLGVEVFFVISGFVIPLSMRNTQYQWRDLGSFFIKRFLRVHPPFVVASVVVILLNILSSFTPGFAGSIGEGYLAESMVSLAADATYSSGPLGRSWILVVAWTLAIEVQFYLLVGLGFPLIERCGPWLRMLLFPLLASTAWLLPDGRFIMAFLPYFALGWVGIDLRAKVWAPTLATTTLTGAVVYVLCPLPEALAATLAFLFIVFWKAPLGGPWLWLGTISYSLYLVHVPIGGRVVNLLDRVLATGWQMAFAALIGTLVSLFGAWVFFKVVEKPCHRVSRKILRRNRPGVTCVQTVEPIL